MATPTRAEASEAGEAGAANDQRMNASFAARAGRWKGARVDIEASTRATFARPSEAGRLRGPLSDGSSTTKTAQAIASAFFDFFDADFLPKPHSSASALARSVFSHENSGRPKWP